MPIENISASNGEKTLKSPAMAVLAMLAILLAGSVVYFRERMLFIDAPHVFFRVVNDGRLHIEEHRFGSFITQFFPLAGSWLHVPFTPLLIVYSASFYFFYMVAALLLVFKYRSYGLAILFGLYLSVFVSDTFYWPNNEVHQGIAWLMLAFAVNFRAATRGLPLAITAPLFAASFALAIWTHPLVMFAALFLWFFFWIDGAKWPFSTSSAVIYSVILLSLAWLKFFQGSHGGYDSSKIEMVAHLQPGRMRLLLASPMLHFFIRGCIANYWLVPVLFLAGAVNLVRTKKYLLLLYTTVCSAGFLALVCITFWDVHSGRFYIESEYMPLALICCAPFVYTVLPGLPPRGGIIAISLVFLVRLLYIQHAAAAFTNRLAILDRINTRMTEKHLTKLIIPEPVPGADSSLIMNWGAPVESIFLSKLKGQQPQRTFIFVPQDLLPFTSVGKDTLLSSWEKRAIKGLNSRYFQVDTMSGYSVINYSTLME